MTNEEIIAEIKSIKEKFDDIRNSMLYIETKISCLSDDIESCSDYDALDIIENIENHCYNITGDIGIKDTGIMGELRELEAFYMNKELSQI